MAHQIAPFGLRMPPDLKARVQALATEQGRSMNNLIVHLLKSATEKEQRA